MGQIKIAVLMACYNRLAVTRRCLRALFDNSFNLDVWLVDDASPDKTGEVVEKEFPQVHVIKGSGKLFWAKGMALAWREAARHDYDFYLWLNDDVILYPDAARGILDDYDKCNSVIVGACCEPIGKVISYGATDANDQKVIPNEAPQKSDGWLNGNVVLIPRDVYQRVGIISDEYTHARADYDYAERLKKAGIPFCSSSKFVGECHYEFDAKMRGKSLWQRIQLLWRPGYWNLHDLWLIRSRYHGYGRAIVSSLHLVAIAFRGVK